MDTDAQTSSRYVEKLPGPQGKNSRPLSDETTPSKISKFAPTKFRFATVDCNTSFRGVVDLAKLRCRIECDSTRTECSVTTKADH
jgi:hypothetical protein